MPSWPIGPCPCSERVEWSAAPADLSAATSAYHRAMPGDSSAFLDAMGNATCRLAATSWALSFSLDSGSWR
jgi:hypothetical protein